MSLFSKLFQSKTEPVKQETESVGLVKEDFRVTGVAYYTANIKKLACANEDWKKSGKKLAAEGRVMEKIFRYTYINKPVKLIHEPKNPHDKNAVAVYVAGEQVGYIPAEDAPHVRQVLSSKKIKYISSFIGGGDYKVVSEDGTVVKMDGDVKISVRIAYA